MIGINRSNTTQVSVPAAADKENIRRGKIILPRIAAPKQIGSNLLALDVHSLVFGFQSETLITDLVKLLPIQPMSYSIFLKFLPNAYRATASMSASTPNPETPINSPRPVSSRFIHSRMNIENPVTRTNTDKFLRLSVSSESMLLAFVASRRTNEIR